MENAKSSQAVFFVFLVFRSSLYYSELGYRISCNMFLTVRRQRVTRYTVSLGHFEAGEAPAEAHPHVYSLWYSHTHCTQYWPVGAHYYYYYYYYYY